MSLYDCILAGVVTAFFLFNTSVRFISMMATEENTAGSYARDRIILSNRRSLWSHITSQPSMLWFALAGICWSVDWKASMWAFFVTNVVTTIHWITISWHDYVKPYYIQGMQDAMQNRR